MELLVFGDATSNGFRVDPITAEHEPDFGVKENLNKNNGDSDVLEAVLSHIGEMGRYQKLLFLGMAPFGIFFAFIYFVQMFITATPQKYWCRVSELSHLEPSLRRNLTAPHGGDLERCVMFNISWGQVLDSLSVPDPSTPTVPCQNGWEFELGDIPYHTVVSERGWVCEYAGYAPLAQSLYFAGAFVGSISFGWIADNFGRVPALVGSTSTAFIGGVASIYTTELWDFVFCRFLVGMSHDSIFIIMYILVLEYVGPRHRTWVANMSIALFFAAGCMMLPWLALWLADWRKLVWVTTAPMLIVVFVPFVVPESARWLSSKGRVNQAVNVLRRFEKVNGTKIPQDVMDKFIVSSSRTRKTDHSIKYLFKSATLRMMLLFMVIVYMSCAVVYDGLVRMTEGLGLDFFINFTLTSAAQTPAITLMAFLLDRWGRRCLTSGPTAIAGTLSLIAAFVPKGIPQATLVTMAYFAINMSFTAAMQWITELLPTPVRASGSSLIHVSSFVASIVSPFIIYSERVWRSLPLLLLGCISLVAACVGLLLPETMGRPMPQTIEDGERTVRENTLCGKKKTFDETGRHK